MKKLIITIFIIFIYSTPQVFAVLPPMFRYTAFMVGAGLLINNYLYYVNSANQIKWYLPRENDSLDIKYRGTTYYVPLGDIMKEALNEWTGGFRRRPITFVRTYNINEARIQFIVDKTTNYHNLFALANYREEFTSNPNAGVIAIYKTVLAKYINDVNYVNRFHDAIGKPNLSIDLTLRYMTKYLIKHEPGHLFGLLHTLLQIDEIHVGLGNNAIDPSMVRHIWTMLLGITTPTTAPSIMIENMIDYFRYLRQYLGRPVEYGDITVTEGDRMLLVEEDRCVIHPPETQTEGSIKLNCNTVELMATITSSLANNTAKTTALTSQN